MTQITVDLSGFDRVDAEVRTKTARFLRAEAEDIVTDIKLSMTNSPAGPNSYKRTKTGKRHYSSIEGNPPRVDYGALRASMRHELINWHSAQVLDGVEYGVYLEDGTERMGARPFMAPAFDRAGGGFGERFRKWLNL